MVRWSNINAVHHYRRRDTCDKVSDGCGQPALNHFAMSSIPYLDEHANSRTIECNQRPVSDCFNLGRSIGGEMT